MHLWPVEHFFLHFLVPVVLEVPKSDENVFNWSWVHSERSDFLQNPYFNTVDKETN